MLEKVIAAQDVWALPTTGGVLVGKGVRVQFRLKSGPGLHALWCAMREVLTAGERSVEELVLALGPTFPPGAVRSVVPQLLRVGLLTKAPPETAAPARTVCIGLIGDERLTGRLRPLLEEAGVRPRGALNLPPSHVPEAEAVSRLVSQSDLVLAAAQSAIARLQIFPVVNEACVKQKKPWLGGYLDQDQVVLGPLTVPGETACFRCLELREENHLPNLADYREFRALVGSVPSASGYPGDTVASAMLLQALVAETLRYAADEVLPATYRTLIEIDLVSFETSKHAVLKVPLCDVCGPHVDRPFRRAWSL